MEVFKDREPKLTARLLQHVEDGCELILSVHKVTSTRSISHYFRMIRVGRA